MPKNDIHTTTNRCRQLLVHIYIILSLLVPGSGAFAQSDTSRVYTEEHPLVYEDADNLWPYSFLNDDGEPDGYNIDILKMLLQELDIPYVINLKPQQEVFSDLRARKADLMIGLAAGFNDMPALAGRNAIFLSTQSVVTPKSKPVAIKNFRDLSTPGTQVIVSDSGFCHHLMLDYGWNDNIVVSEDIRRAIMQVNEKQEGQIVWNSLALKWLISHYQLDQVQLTPVNMPHGEYKFISHDQKLLDILDEAYSQLYTLDKLEPLENKWFYPEHDKPQTTGWGWYLVGLSLLLGWSPLALLLFTG